MIFNDYNKAFLTIYNIFFYSQPAFFVYRFVEHFCIIGDGIVHFCSLEKL